MVAMVILSIQLGTNRITIQNFLLMTIMTTQINQLCTATEHVLIW